MSISIKNRGGNPTKRLRDKKGRFRKMGKDTKKQIKKQPPKKKSKSKQKKSPKKTKNKLETESASVTNSLPIAYGHVYSTSCGHCNAMQEDWDGLTQDVGTKVELCDIGDDHSNEVRQFNDRFHSTLNYDGFPTVFKLTQQGNPVEYYDNYYKKQKNDFDQGISTIDPPPFRSRESMKVWILGG